MIGYLLWFLAIWAVILCFTPLLCFSLFWFEAVNSDHWETIKRRYGISGWSIFFKTYGASVVSLLRVWMNWPLRFFCKYWRVPSTHPSHTPVVFVHGFFHDRSAWVFYLRLFRAAGLSHLYSIDLKRKFSSIEDLALQLHREVDSILAACETKQVDIVAHSMGGIVSRYYIQKLGASGKVRKVITLGTPHCGTKLAAFMLGKARNELLPKSPFWESLKQEKELFLKNREIAVFYSDSDFMVLPPSLSHLDNPEVQNINVGLVSHIEFLYNRKIANEVLKILRSEEIFTDEENGGK